MRTSGPACGRRREPSLRRQAPMRHRPSRRGVASLQLVLVLPTLVLVSIAVFEFGLLMLVQQTVTTAATEGARAAAREASQLEARAAAVAQVNRVLSLHNLAIDPTSSDTSSDTKLLLEYGNLPPLATGDPDLACPPPAGPNLGLGEVRVTVCVDATTSPLMNALSVFGLDLMGRRMTISCLVAREL